MPLHNTYEGPEARADLSLRISRLTPGQKLCLLLVARHLSSKEIALRLGVSSHTVDQRIRGALRTLNVTRRKDAAVLLLGHEATPRPRSLAPFAQRGAETNQLTIGWRLAWIVLIAFGSALVSGIMMAALESIVAIFQE